MKRRLNPFVVRIVISFFLLIPLLFSCVQNAQAVWAVQAGQTLVVTSRQDSGAGTLREKLTACQPGDTITFDSSVFPPSSPKRIYIESRLPYITVSGLTIDGSQAGVILDGSRMSEGNAFYIENASNVIVRGLQIVNFPYSGVAVVGNSSQVVIGGSRAIGAAPLGQGNLFSGNQVGVFLSGQAVTNSTILGNYIGVNATGTAIHSNEVGVVLDDGAHGNLVGGETPDTGNLISGNTNSGIRFQLGAYDNRVVGNIIGLDASGTQALGNALGIVMTAASNNIIGGTTQAARNIISGNQTCGFCLYGSGVFNNTIQGNYIGVDPGGKVALGNAIGVDITEGAHSNLIGGTAPDVGNVISGNQYYGVYFTKGANSNQVAGNKIGTDAGGNVALGNSSGVMIDASAGNIIGGNTEAARNIISGNQYVGVSIDNEASKDNLIASNFIGLNAAGTAGLGQPLAGIQLVTGAQNNRIGGTTPGARNVISGNGDGILMEGLTTSGNNVQGNFIGTDASGTYAIAGQGHGIKLQKVSGNRIGGSGQGEGNVISGNTIGITIDNESTGNGVEGNYIGTDWQGLVDLGDQETGVSMIEGANNNWVGGTSPASRNLISGNKVGVFIASSTTKNNKVQGNFIGTDRSGNQALGNDEAGVLIGGGASSNLVVGNVIGGNGYTIKSGAGVTISGTGTQSNQVSGNYIGIGADGASAVSNQNGILILYVAGNTIGGDTPDERNVVSGNTRYGIYLEGAGAQENKITGNFIGTNADGTAAVANSLSGVAINLGASNNTIGGKNPGEGNLISGNTQAGILLSDQATTGNRMFGNSIGTDASGSPVLGNGFFGVSIIHAPGNEIGGPNPGEGNFISGNKTTGISITGSGAVGNKIIGNQVLYNITFGITLSDGPRQTVVGPNNMIAYNGNSAVTISGQTTVRNTITRNRIFSNGGLPIESFDDAQPIAPELSIDVKAGEVHLSGKACENCKIEFFRNPDTRPGGVQYAGETTADSNGFFQITLPQQTALPYWSSTETSVDGTTYEFFYWSTSAITLQYFMPVVLH